MTRICSCILILLALGLIGVAGSLTAGNANDQSPGALSTTGGGTMPPVKEFNTAPINVIAKAPMDVVDAAPSEPVQPPDTKPYTERAPVDPERVNTKVEDDDQNVSMSGVSKITLYLEKEPPPSVGADMFANKALGEEMPGIDVNEGYRAYANPYFVGSGQVNSPIPDQGWHWRRVKDTLGQAPAGAVVTNLEYRMWIGPQTDPSSFYCADYEIHLFTGAADRELMIYDNLGGRTDGGFDDDADDDGDIYLNHRTTHFFDGDDAQDWFGVWIDDVYASDSGQLNYIEFWVHWELPLPNLTCYKPAEWDSAIVASSVTGTHTADSLTGGEPAYIDWAVINNGAGDVVGRFYTALYIDGNYITQWFTDDLGATWWAWVADYAQTLDTGYHEICIIADHSGLIAEENEQDNSCCFTYYWNPPYVPPDLHCYSPGWDGPIVVSAVRGTNTQDTIRLCDTAFVDWAVGNSGGSPTADRYYVRLLVDGTVVAAWFKDPPHDNGFYIWVTDHPMFFTTAGTHTVSLEIDYTGAIAEGNEANNSCEVATVVIECLDPDIACFAPDGWDGPIVVSGVAGTITQGPVTVGETAYIDFALANIGTAATTVNIYHTLYIDGDSTMTWFSTPMNPGDFRWVSDYPFTFATPGLHTVMVFHDVTDVVSEPDEVNNICEYIVDVQPATIVIAGQVHDPGGVGIPNVTMTFTDVGVVMTEGNGFYEQAVPVGWSGRVTPSKECLEFVPPYRDYVNVTTNLTNQNYEGSVVEYLISGYVQDSDNAGIDGVEMVGLPGEIFTNENGYYAAQVPCGWDGTVTPTKDCWVFSPTSLNYNNVTMDLANQDYTGAMIIYSLSGTVNDVGGPPMAGVVMTGLPCPDVITDINGFYSCTVPCGWSGTVTPVATDCGFSPPSRSYVNLHGSMSDEDYIGECGPPSCDPGFEVAVVTGEPGGYVGVGILANGMQSTPIGGLEFHLTYPMACLACSEVVSDYLTSPTVNCDNGEVHIIWDDFADPAFVPDGQAIATIIFEVLGQTGETCEICWLGGNEVVDPIGDPIPGLGYCCGSVFVEETTHSNDTLFIGDSDYISVLSPVTLYFPIYLNNHQYLDGGTLPLCYDWSFDPDSVSFVGTRLETMDYYTGLIDSLNNQINMGFLADIGSGNPPLEPIDEFSSDSCIAKIYFTYTCDTLQLCDTTYLNSVDTCRIEIAYDTLYLMLLDTLGTENIPVVVKDSIQIEQYRPGDANGDCRVNVSDVWYLLNYIFNSTTEPVCYKSGDVNGDCTANISDAWYLLNYIFLGGPPPVPYCYNSAYYSKLCTGSAQLTISTSSDNDVRETVISIFSNQDVYAVQLEFEKTSGMGLPEVASLVQGMQVHSGSNNEMIKIGLIDITARYKIDASYTDMIRLRYHADEDIRLVNAILVGKNGGSFNYTVVSQSKVIPNQFELGQNIPNPFNPYTEIPYGLPYECSVRLEVFNLLGQRVVLLVNENQTAGTYRVTWDSRDSDGMKVSSGIYFYRLIAGDYSESRKMLLMK